jgi:hypothetical protein
MAATKGIVLHMAPLCTNVVASTIALFGVTDVPRSRSSFEKTMLA